MPFRPGLHLSLLALLALAGLLPGAAAVPYEGPGQKGAVPVGEGGLLVPHLKGVADDRLFVALQGVPADACRLVLDANGTYAATGVTWRPGEDIAYVWSEPGGKDTPYRLHAVWTTDLNDACTVERTESETIWHDPRGRPYVDLRVLEDKPIVAGPAGTNLTVRFTLHNNGTVADNVTAQVAVAKDTFQVTAPDRVSDVPVGPLEEAAFVFDVAVPRDTKPRPYPVQINFVADSGWRQAATAILEVKPPVGPEPTPTTAPDPAAAEPLPPPSVTPQEAPGSIFVVLAACALALAGRRRQ